MPSVRDVLRIAFRHKWFILSIFLFISIAGGTVVMMMTNVYQSQGGILLRDQRNALAIDDSNPGVVTGSTRSASGSFASESAILSSPALAEDVVRLIGPERVLGLRHGKTIETAFAESPNPTEAAVKSAAKILKKSMTINGEGNNISVLYNHNDPQAAHDILDGILQVYLKRHIAAYSSSASPELLKQQVEQLKAELDKTNVEYAKFQQEHNVTAIAPELDAVDQQVRTMEEELATTRADREASKAALSQLQEQLTGRKGETNVGPTEVVNPEVIALQERLRQLKAERLTLGSKFTDKSSEMKHNASEIASVQAEIKTLPGTVSRQFGASSSDSTSTDPMATLQQETAEYQRFVARVDSLETDLKKNRERLVELRQFEPAGTALADKLKTLNEDYAAAVSGLRKIETSAALDSAQVSNVSIVQPATLPVEPVAPRRTRMILMMLFAGLAAGLGLAFAREFFDDTVKSRDEAETKLGMTVLAVVPEREFRKCI